MSSKAGNSFKNFGLRTSSSSRDSSSSTLKNTKNTSSISSSASVTGPPSRPGSVSSMVGGSEPSFKRSSAPVVMGGGMSPKVERKGAVQMARISQEQAGNSLRQTQSNLHISEKGDTGRLKDMIKMTKIDIKINIKS